MKLFTWRKRLIKKILGNLTISTLNLLIIITSLINCNAVIGAMIYRWEGAWYYGRARALMNEASESQDKQASAYKRMDSVIKEFRASPYKSK